MKLPYFHSLIRRNVNVMRIMRQEGELAPRKSEFSFTCIGFKSMNVVHFKEKGPCLMPGKLLSSFLVNAFIIVGHDSSNGEQNFTVVTCICCIFGWSSSRTVLERFVRPTLTPTKSACISLKQCPAVRTCRGPIRTPPQKLLPLFVPYTSLV